MMKKTCFALIIILTQQLHLVSQDIKVNKQYITAPDLINPAFTGNELCFKTNLISTFQWLGMDDAPRTILLDASKGFNRNHFETNSKHGLGGTLYNDRNGPFSFTGIRLAYAFHAFINKKKEIRFSLGLSASGTWYSLNEGLLFYDPTVIPSSPELDYARNNSIAPNAGAGAVFYFKKAYLGLSAMNLLPLYPSYESAPVSKTEYILIAGYKSYLKRNSNIMLEPILLLKYSNSSISNIDISMLATLNQAIGMGITYRHSLADIPGTYNSLALRLSMIKNRWTFTYVYDLGFNSLQFNSMGNHEICIGYKTCRRKEPKCSAY